MSFLYLSDNCLEKKNEQVYLDLAPKLDDFLTGSVLLPVVPIFDDVRCGVSRLKAKSKLYKKLPKVLQKFEYHG